MRECVGVAKALSDPHRLRALLFLRAGELCVCEIVEMLGLAPSTVSKHMAVLHQAGLVESRKEGRWVYYRRSGRGAPVCAREALRWVDRCLTGDRRAAEDRRRLETVRRMNRARLCRCYRRPAGQGGSHE